MHSFDIKDKFQEAPISVEIYHSLKNCVVNINHLESLLNYKPSSAWIDLNRDEFTDKSATLTRVSNYIDGGHDLLFENP